MGIAIAKLVVALFSASPTARLHVDDYLGQSFRSAPDSYAAVQEVVLNPAAEKAAAHGANA